MLSKGIIVKGEWIHPPPNKTAVVFLHGVLSSGESCWTHSNGTYWPTLVTDAFHKSVGVYVFTYKTTLLSGGFSIGDVTASLWEHFRLDNVLNNKEIIFVCHSMGGIVARKFIVRYQERIHHQGAQIGLFLLGSPTLGSRYANLLSPLIGLFRHSQGEVLKFSAQNLWLNELDVEFNSLRLSGEIPIFGKELIEDTATISPNLIKRQIVEPFAGARYFGDPYKVPDTNHFTICKVSGSDSVQHRILCAFIAEFRDWANRSKAYSNQDGYSNRKYDAHSTQDVKLTPSSKQSYGTPTLSQAPSPPSHFVGRPEITDAIKDLLIGQKNDQALVVSAIQGLGGIGKTAIASFIAHDGDIQRTFSDGVLWATLGQNPDLQQWLNNWIQALGDHNFVSNDPEVASSHLRSLLSGRSILLVVDDVWSSSDARLFLVGGRKCRIIITTRLRDIAGDVDAQLYEIGLLSEKQSLTLVEAKISRNISDEETALAHEIVKAVGYLPLAVELVAAQIGRGVQWIELIKAFREEVARLEALENPRQRRSGENRLEACFNLSLSRLRAQDKKAWKAFVMLGILPEDTPFDAEIIGNAQGISADEASDILELLFDDALLLASVASRTKRSGARKTYRLHDLLYDVARRLMTAQKPKGLGTTLKESHRQLVLNYRSMIDNSQWSSLPDDGYIRRHLFKHLRFAGMFNELEEVLDEENNDGTNAWYRSNEQLGYTSGFAEDLELSISILCNESNYDIRFEDKLNRILRHALSLSSVNSIASGSPPELMTARVYASVWTPEQALAYARLVRNRLRRLEAFASLIPFQEQTSAGEISKILSQEIVNDTSINNEEICGLLARDLPPHVIARVHERLLSSERFYGVRRERAEAISKLAPFMDKDRRRELKNEILNWSSISIDRIIALSGLLPYLTGVDEIEAERTLEGDIKGLSPQTNWARIYAKACTIGMKYRRGRSEPSGELMSFLKNVPDTYSTKRSLALKVLPAATVGELETLRIFYGPIDDVFVRTLSNKFCLFGDEAMATLFEAVSSPYHRAIVASTAAMLTRDSSSTRKWLKLADEQTAILTDAEEILLNKLLYSVIKGDYRNNVLESMHLSETGPTTRMLLAMAGIAFCDIDSSSGSHEDFFFGIVTHPTAARSRGLASSWGRFPDAAFLREGFREYSYDQLVSLRLLDPSLKLRYSFNDDTDDAFELKNSKRDFRRWDLSEGPFNEKGELTQSLSYSERTFVMIEKYAESGRAQDGWSAYLDAFSIDDIDPALIFAIGMQRQPFTPTDLVKFGGILLRDRFRMPKSLLVYAEDETSSLASLLAAVMDIVETGRNSTRDNALLHLFFLQCLTLKKNPEYILNFRLALEKVESWWKPVFT